MSDRLLADFACLGAVYVDGIFAERVANLGTTFTTPFFRWVPTTNENGVMVLERTAALLVVRPRSSLLPRSPLAALLDRQAAPQLHASEIKQLVH